MRNRIDSAEVSFLDNSQTNILETDPQRPLGEKPNMRTHGVKVIIESVKQYYQIFQKAMVRSGDQ